MMRFSAAFLALIFVAVSAFISGNARAQDAKPESAKTESTTPVKKTKSSKNKKPVQPDFTELKTDDTTVGKGKEALKGKTIKVNYSGWLYDPNATKDHGKLFASSNNGADTAVFTLGSGAMIRGWDEGLIGMKVGGKRTLNIPSEMGYGKRGAGEQQIPAGAGLIFEVELLDVMDVAPASTPSVN
jgi:FKBP-type peptidyl-prolyl cis-trans isomerase FkpA